MDPVFLKFLLWLRKRQYNDFALPRIQSDLKERFEGKLRFLLKYLVHLLQNPQKDPSGRHGIYLQIMALINSLPLLPYKNLRRTL